MMNWKTWPKLLLRKSKQEAVCVCVCGGGTVGGGGGVILKTRADVQKHGMCGVGNKCSARF